MATRKTTITVEAQGKGLERTKRELSGIGGELKKSKEGAAQLALLGKAADDVSKSVKGMAQQFKTLDQQMKSMSWAKQLKALREEMGKLTEAMGSRGAVGAGGIGSGRLLAGVGIGAAGMYAYGKARQLGGAPFSGVGGLAQAVGAIPVVGGFMAGQVNNLMATAGQGLGSYQQRMGLLPGMDAAANMQRQNAAVDAAREGARTGAAARVARAGRAASQAVRNNVFEANLQRLVEMELDERAPRQSGVERALMGSQAAAPYDQNFRNANRPFIEARLRKELEPNRDKIERMAAMPGAGGKSSEQARVEAERAERKQIAREEAAAARKARLATDPFRRFETGGRGMGFGPAEARQFLGQFLNTAGGGSSAVSNQGFQTALAAQRLYGIGATTSAQFQRAGYMGMGDGTQNLKDTIAAGFKAGLTGSDLTRYVEQAAQSLANFERTGIAMDVTKSLGAQQGLARRFGTVRGNFMAQQLRQGAQNIAMTGPQTGLQYQALRDLGGYNPAGGQAGFFEAMMRMEEGNFGGEELDRFIANTTAGAGGQYYQAERLITAFRRMGVSVGRREALSAVQGDRSGIQAVLDAGADRAAGVDDMVDTAGKVTPGALKRQAGLDLTKEGVGRTMVGIAQTLERGQVNALRNFSKLNQEMQAIATTLKDFATNGSEKMVKAVEKLEAVVEKMSQSGALQ